MVVLIKRNKILSVLLAKLFLDTITYSIYLPALEKLIGLYWTIHVIAATQAINHICNMGAFMFRKLSIAKLLEVLILIEIIYALLIFVYFVNENLYLYATFFFGTIYGVVSSSYSIKVHTWLSKQFKNEYETIQYLWTISFNISSIVGLILVLLTKLLDFGIKEVLIFASCFDAVLVMYRLVHRII